jgi:hypothetical protein
MSAAVRPSTSLSLRTTPVIVASGGPGRKAAGPG